MHAHITNTVQPDEREALLALLNTPRPRVRPTPRDPVAELKALADELWATPGWRPPFQPDPRPHWPDCRHTNYHLTCEEFEMLNQEADGFCDICGKDCRATTQTMHIDHDHAVGWRAVRGLLCASCNITLATVDLGSHAPDRAMAHYLNDPWYGRVGLEDLGCPDGCNNADHRKMLAPQRPASHQSSGSQRRRYLLAQV